MARFVEALLNKKDGCLAGEAAAFATWSRKNPYRWKRELRWWEIAILARSQKKLSAQLNKKEKPKMLSITGEAQFVEEGKMLEIVTRVQPMTPHEHAMLERIVKHYGEADLTMEKGNLVLKIKMPVPAEEDALYLDVETEEAQEELNENAQEAAKEQGAPVVEVPKATAD